MLVVLLVSVAVILVGMIVVGIGRGGEMAEFIPDVRPVDTDIETAADVALLRPPKALWGYDQRSTDEALNLVARTVTERDVEIATLRRQIADMQADRAGGDQQSGAPPGAAGPPGVTWDPGPAGPPAAGPPAAQADPGSAAVPFPRRPAGPAPPPPSAAFPPAPAPEASRWSAWERPGPVPRPEDSGSAEPAASGEPGDPREPGDT